MARRSDYTSQDPLARRARAEGFAARSIYKLEEIDRRHRLLRRGARVLDLGAAPGSWSQYVLPRIGPGGVLVAVDLQPIDVALPGAVVLERDAMALEAEDFTAAAGDRVPPFDLVLSDMAPSTTGVPFSDHVASVELCDRALDLATRWLAPGGAFVCKLFQGGEEPALRKRIQARFARLSSIRPEATRARSVEIFLIATGYGPRT
jgi:23S rRNA (uridine2552-2'-O)-methyltransferase